MRCEKCNDVVLMLYGKPFCANPDCEWEPNGDGVFAEELIEDASIDIMLSRIETQGKRAYYDMLKPDNPYDEETGEFKAWQRGWDAEQKMTKEFALHQQTQETLNTITDKRGRLVRFVKLLKKDWHFGGWYRKHLKEIDEDLLR